MNPYLLTFGSLATIFVVGMYVGMHPPREDAHPLRHEHSRLTLKLCSWWKSLQDRVHKHHRLFHRMHGFVHLSYFTTVFTHGPYNMVAGVLLVIGVLGWILHLEEV